jgi:hypothetical protein
MSKIIKIENNEHFLSVIKSAGYTVVVFARASDWPSTQVTAQCAAYSREYPYVRFCIVDIDTVSLALVGSACVTYVPTIAFYRTGESRGQVVGTDYIEIEKRLAAMRRDGAALVAARGNTGKHYIFAPENAAIFAPRRTRK